MQERQQHRKGLFRTIVLVYSLLSLFLGLLEQRRKHNPVGSLKPPDQNDVALIEGPTGPYVLSLFLYRPGWMDWETSNSAMKDTSRIVWNFFEFQESYLDGEAPPMPELTPPPGYVPLGQFVPAE